MSHPDDGVLQELLDGELAAADEAAVRAHLAACAACTALLEDLKATQLEAAAIVARLELDPPLQRPARPVHRARPVNLRLLGLAASTVLVAGTSWLLLRTSPEEDRAFFRVADSGADATLEPPREERERGSAVPPPGAATPAPPPARMTVPAAVDERKALADAAPVVSGEDAPRQRRNKDEATAPPAVPAAGAMSAAAANRAADVSVQEVAAPSATLADAEAQLGWKVRTIAGLTPQSVELVPGTPDSASGVRQRYQVGTAVVVLVQRTAPSGDKISLRGGRVDETAQQRLAPVEPAAPAGKKDRAPGVAAAKTAESATPIRVWQSGGVMFELWGALPADSLDALMQRVR